MQTLMFQCSRLEGHLLVSVSLAVVVRYIERKYLIIDFRKVAIQNLRNVYLLKLANHPISSILVVRVFLARLHSSRHFLS